MNRSLKTRILRLDAAARERRRAEAEEAGRHCRQPGRPADHPAVVACTGT
jgi:hypothetical protein